MITSNRNIETGSLKYLAAAFGSLILVWVTALLGFSNPATSFDLEGKRGIRRIELRAKVTKEEELKCSLANQPEWISKESGTVRLPLSVGMDITVTDLVRKNAGASGVKVDPVVAFGVDVPKMPSSPLGASTIRFPMLSSPLPTKTGN